MDLYVKCCDQLAESVTLLVADENSSYSECDDNRISYNPTTLIFQCTPPRSGKYVILEFLSQTWNPPTSSAAVSGFGKSVNTIIQQYATARKDVFYYYSKSWSAFSFLRSQQTEEERLYIYKHQLAVKLQLNHLEYRVRAIYSSKVVCSCIKQCVCGKGKYEKTFNFIFYEFIQFLCSL